MGLRPRFRDSQPELSLMWLFTPYGFYSVSCARQSAKQYDSPIDPTTKMIRARSILHLQNLQDRFPTELGEYTIATSAGTDYHARLVVPMEQWESVALQLAQEIDYGNFKSRCSSERITEDSYLDLLHKVWGAHYGFQQSVSPKRSRSGHARIFGPDSHADESEEEGEEVFGYAEVSTNAIATGEPFVLVSRREKAGSPTPVAILIGFPAGKGRTVAQVAATAGAIDRIPKARLTTSRGEWGDAVPTDLPVFDLGYTVEFS